MIVMWIKFNLAKQLEKTFNSFPKNFIHENTDIGGKYWCPIKDANQPAKTFFNLCFLYFQRIDKCFVFCSQQT